MARAAALVLAAAAVANAQPTPADVLSAMAAATNYYIGTNTITTADCDWLWGTYYTGHMAYYNITGNATLLTLANEWGKYHSYACNNVTNANSLACGQSYIEMYLADTTPNAAKLNIQYTLDNMIASGQNKDWTWVDALFMAMPTFARMGRTLANTTFWDKMYAEYEYTAYLIGDRGLWSSTFGFFYRDTTFFNDTSPNGKPVFWARGNGWAVSALLRSLSALPPPSSNAYAADYAGKFVTMAASLLAAQGADGLWRTNLLDAAAFPAGETTGSAMFTYAFAWGVNNGLLSAGVYKPAALAGWKGLTTISLQPSGLVGWCQPPGAAPGAAGANDTSPFCVGQFLLAGSEVYKMLGGATVRGE